MKLEHARAHCLTCSLQPHPLYGLISEGFEEVGTSNGTDAHTPTLLTYSKQPSIACILVLRHLHFSIQPDNQFRRCSAEPMIASDLAGTMVAPSSGQEFSYSSLLQELLVALVGIRGDVFIERDVTR